MATAVFFHAHPDDESIATGGSMRLAAEAGHRVVLVAATAGEHGEPVEGVLGPGEVLGDRRRAETHAAGEILGVDRVAFLGYRDSGMMGEPTNDHPDAFWAVDPDEASTRLATILTEEAPAVITVYDDHGGYGHPDHINVHRVGVAAAHAAGVPLVLQATMNRDAMRRSMRAAVEQGDDVDDELRARLDSLDDPANPFGTPESDITHAIDVSAALDAKRAAMAAHASQIGPDSFFLAMDDDRFASAFGTEWYTQLGAQRSDGPFVGDIFTAL